jgi:Bacterial Ig-like domain
MHYIRIIIISTILLTVWSCAVPGEISGGPKDTTPPKIIAYFPDSHLLNFNGKLISFEFDEKVQIKNLSTQLLITPNMEEQPQISADGKKINIEFKSVLPQNSTYVFNFGNAISDINEGNSINDFKYIFSTGSFIDSLKVSGKVKDAFTNSSVKDIKVILYADTGKMDIIKRKPDYFVKTNNDGIFQFTNIKSGNYKLLAIEDKNNNGSYDNKDERIGFLDSTFIIDKDLELTEISIFKEEEDLRLSKKSLSNFGRLDFYFTQGVDEVTLNSLNNKIKVNLLGPYYNRHKDSISYFYSEKIEDTLQYSLNTKKKTELLIDTLFIPPVLLNDKKQEASGKGSGRRDNQAESLKPILKLGRVLHYNDTLKLFSNIPLQTIIEPPQVKLGKFNLKGNWKINDKDPRMLISDIIIAADKDYSLVIKGKSISSIYEKPNDSLALNFKTQANTYYGEIRLTVKPNDVLMEQPYIVKLIDEKGNIVEIAEKNQAHVYDFKYLTPLDYNLKIEIGDKKWQTGSYKKKRQAALVFNYEETIKLRSDWISEIAWLIH